MAKNEPKSSTIDNWDDADEVFIPQGVDVKTIEEWTAENVEIKGIYLGCREVESENGAVTIHYFFGPLGLLGMWGSLAIDSGLANAIVGRDTFVEYKGTLKLKGDRRLKQVRIRQRGEVQKMGRLALAAGIVASNGSPDDAEAPF